LADQRDEAKRKENKTRIVFIIIKRKCA